MERLSNISILIALLIIGASLVTCIDTVYRYKTKESKRALIFRAIESDMECNKIIKFIEDKL
jgi:hypothetical protein